MFLDEARWSASGLIAYQTQRDVRLRMFDRAATSGRVDRDALRWFGPSHHRHDPMIDELVDPLLASGDYWQLLRALTDPCSFRSPAYWSLLWALLIAEQDFQTQWVDGWSHEERMTGHFLTTIVHTGREMGPTFLTLDRACGGGSKCSIDYVDTAIGRQERLTGADFGVIVQGTDTTHGEWIKVALIQVTG